MKLFRRSLIMRFAAGALATAWLADGARAEEIRLLSAAAMQTVFAQVIPQFERTSGHRVSVHYGTIGAINQWVLDGEEADLVIGSSVSLPALVKAGRIEPGSDVAICKTGIGIVAPSGDARPPIRSVEEFKDTLLGAKILVYADPVRGGAAGVHISGVLKRLGLFDQLRPRIKYGAGGDITEVTLAFGSGTIGMTQVSEIVDKPGAQFVGSFPQDLQNYTIFVAGLPRGAQPSAAVRAFIDFMKGPTGSAAIEARGMEPVRKPGAS